MRNIILHLESAILTEKCSICMNFFERARGLLFRPALTKTAGDALLIPRCNSIHTFWMKYPIGVIFLDSEQRILAIYPHVSKRRIVSHKKAKFALEVASGNPWALDLKVGDRIDWK
jgi:uncharacterized protein